MNTMPTILKETSQGYVPLAISDELFMHRKIFIYEEINDELAGRIIMQMKYLESEDSSADIELYINSPGGSVYSGLAIYDCMMSSPCPVTTVCTGMAASMASILFSAGSRRIMHQHAVIMIHDPLIENTGGSALRLQSTVERIMDIRKTMTDIYMLHTGLSADEIQKMTSGETWLDAEEAVRKGFADEVIHNRKGEKQE